MSPTKRWGCAYSGRLIDYFIIYVRFNVGLSCCLRVHIKDFAFHNIDWNAWNNNKTLHYSMKGITMRKGHFRIIVYVMFR